MKKMRTVSLAIAVPIRMAVRRFRYRAVYRRFRNYTMIPYRTYVENLELCHQFRRVRGDIVECGTWRGGMIAGIASVFGNARTYHLFDSFEGLPQAKEIDGPSAVAWQANKHDRRCYDNCKADQGDAERAMALSGASHYYIHKGWFNESMVKFSTANGIAILRLDGDWYDSTMDCLVHLFPKINAGGVLIVDDYYAWDGCAKAIHDYLAAHKRPDRIRSHEGICYLIKQ